MLAWFIILKYLDKWYVASFFVLVTGSSDMKVRPDARHCSSPGCGQGMGSGPCRLSQRAPAQVSQDVCDIWKCQSNPTQLVCPKGKPSGQEGNLQHLKHLRAGRWAHLAVGSRKGPGDHKEKEKALGDSTSCFLRIYFLFVFIMNGYLNLSKETSFTEMIM